MKKGDIIKIKEIEESPYFSLIQIAYSMRYGLSVRAEKDIREAAYMYLKFRDEMEALKKKEESVKINKTFAGYLAKRLEYITKPLGFDYKVNIALIGGFAAKEVILSTLGTAYSIGDKRKEMSLSERFRNDPNWNGIKAFALMIFIMLYVPCMATVASISKETSWKWAIFSICFNLIFAYVISFLTLRIGMLII